MKKKLFVFSIIFVLVIVTIGCAVLKHKPSLFTYPPNYLRTFPLDQFSETDLLIKIGPPLRNIEIGGGRAFVYKIAKSVTQVERTFTYIFKDGFVHDIIYNDDGPYNGMSARKLQGKE